MKKLLIFLVGMLFTIACNAKPNSQEVKQPALENQKVLVTYFSATGTTKQVAENLAKAINADIYEIKPLIPYTSEDLNWRNENSRSSKEMKDKNARPKLAEGDLSLKDYDVIYLGFPIWWGTAPRIVNTFLEKYDFSNKKIIIFATSGSSGIGNTDKDLRPSVPNSTTIVKGKTLNGNPSVEELKNWAKTLK